MISPVEIKPSDIIALGALALTGLIYMSAGRKMVVWLLLIVGFLALAFSVFSRAKAKNPSVSQSATVSGSGLSNQVGGNQTINIYNYGVSKATVREQIKEATPASVLSDLAARYPNGFIAFGIAGGKIIREVKGVEVEGDWEHFTLQLDTQTNKVTIHIPFLNITRSGVPYAKLENISFRFPFAERQPVSAWPVRGMWCEVLDVEKKIFLIGFK